MPSWKQQADAVIARIEQMAADNHKRQMQIFGEHHAAEPRCACGYLICSCETKDDANEAQSGPAPMGIVDDNSL